MKRWGMNTYMYAPKDDFKHRAYWRELYTVEEAEYLTGLIQAAKENGVIFIYALSPGLDIGYSNPKEVACLKRKLEQVAQFGCNAFALLFDDIEPDISEADKELFQSFGHAQVSVTNEVYQHLSQPMFLFCPTEYSASRAVPDVRNSEYLNTIGSKLMPGIHILWTGPKVISKVISIESILELSEVLKRPPIIWDNLHANDYDQKRVFLGPYSGRSTDLIPNLHGVLTNPNCEYETNFIPIQTLAMWSKCNQDGKRELSTNDSVSADIKLETENENGSVEDVPSHLSPDTYHPSQALKVAIKEWLNEFYVSKNAYGRVVPGPFLPSPVPSCPPCPPSTLVNPCPPTPTINTCVGVTMTTSVPCQQVPFGGNPSNPLEGDPSAFQPLTNDLMNSLVSGNLPPLLQADTKNDVILEPMDCNPSPRSSECMQERITEKDKQEPENIVTSTVCTKDSGKPVDGTEEMITESTDISNSRKEEEVKQLTKDDVSLLVDLFYLPFGHGSHGLQLLQEFFFLKTNGHIVSEHRKKSHDKPQTPEIEEWYQRAAKFDDMTKNLSRLLMRLTFIPNRSLLYDLYPYLWDIKGVVSLLNSYLKWLALGRVPPAVPGFIPPTCTWFSKGYKEAFMSGDQEPWLFRGGLTAELQRLLPLESVTDLFLYKPPEPPSAKVYTIRPYLTSDEAAVYEVCRKTCDDGLDGSDVFPDSPDLIGGKLVGAFLCISPEYCFVVEDEDGVCGYALAALDAQQFLKKTEIAWIPELCRKYPKPKKEDGNMLTPAEEIISGFHNYKTSVPDLVFKHHPSTLRMSLLPTVTDSSLPKRLLACVFSALKANGSHGVYCEVTVGDKNIMDFYFKLGFLEIALQGTSDDEIYLGRIF
ncbi:protein O-GlcNAcase-like isoform X1 [Limulus polyphemus]|uniref:Protein O-GlcNAcase-like isoform X1 n=1 Tax=Limulus polyphemus TaxID=6850 RepID=A0ABM1BCF9_LIMPO|nr:protein O-GlcNAcase-like isoform X1 [Limulus polyphemus]